MVPLKALCLTTVLSLAVQQVSTTRFCQCENAREDWKFGGIQHVCSGMGNDWCSTNCDWVGGNCDYCEFIPAGFGNDADFAKLKQWCSQQSAYDSSRKRTIRGEDVFCYSYRNRNPGSGLTGCKHYDNGDDPLPPLPPEKMRDMVVDMKHPAPNGGDVVRGCKNLLRKDGQALVDKFRGQHGDCKETKSEALYHQIECPYVRGFANRKRLRVDYEDDCGSFGGEWFDASSVGTMLVGEHGKAETATDEQEFLGDVDGRTMVTGSRGRGRDRESESVEEKDYNEGEASMVVEHDQVQIDL